MFGGYSKNVLKSIQYLGKSWVKEKFAGANELISSVRDNKDLFKDEYANTLNIFRDKIIDKSLKKGWERSKAAVKTGKFIKSEAEADAEMMNDMGMGDLMEGMGDMGDDFNFDDMGDMDSGSDSDFEASTDESEESSVSESSSGDTINETKNTVTNVSNKTFNVQAQNNRDVTSAVTTASHMQLKSSIGLNKATLNAMFHTNEILNKIKDFAKESNEYNIKSFEAIQGTKKFQDISVEAFTDFGAKIQEIAKATQVQLGMYGLNSDGEKLSRSDIVTSSVIDQFGGFDMGNYISGVFKNIKSEIESTDMIQQMLANPLQMGGSMLFDSIIPKDFSEAIANLNEALSFIPSSFVYTMEEWSQSKNWFKNKFAKIFGVNTDTFSDGIGIKKAEAVPYDNITRKAIVEVIPLYLSKILNAVSSLAPNADVGNEIIFDYGGGGFKTRRNATKEVHSRNTKEGFLEKDIKNKILKSYDIDSDSGQRDAYENEIYKIFSRIARQKGRFKGELTDTSGLDEQLTSDVLKSYNLLTHKEQAQFMSERLSRKGQSKARIDNLRKGEVATLLESQLIAGGNPEKFKDITSEAKINTALFGEQDNSSLLNAARRDNHKLFEKSEDRLSQDRREEGYGKGFGKDMKSFGVKLHNTLTDKDSSFFKRITGTISLAANTSADALTRFLLGKKLTDDGKEVTLAGTIKETFNSFKEKLFKVFGDFKDFFVGKGGALEGSANWVKKNKKTLGLVGGGATVGGIVGGLPGMLLGGTAGYLTTTNSVREWLFGKGDEDGVLSKLKNFLSKNKKVLGLGALGLGAVAAVGGVPGILLGAVGGLALSSEKNREWLLGRLDATKAWVKKHQKAIGMTAIGGAAGAAVGGVPGMMLGAAGGFALSTKATRTFLFGEDGKGGIKAKAKKFLDENGKLLGLGAGGATTGVILGSALGPLGMIGGGFLGSLGGFALSLDSTKKWLFGDEETGRKGVFRRAYDSFSETFIGPLKAMTMPLIDEAKSLVNSFRNLTNSIFKRAYKETTKYFAETFTTSFGKPFGEIVEEKLLKPATETFAKIFSPLTNLFKKGMSWAKDKMSSMASNLRERSLRRNKSAIMERAKEIRNAQKDQGVSVKEAYAMALDEFGLGDGKPLSGSIKPPKPSIPPSGGGTGGTEASDDKIKQDSEETKIKKDSKVSVFTKVVDATSSGVKKFGETVVDVVKSIKGSGGAKAAKSLEKSEKQVEKFSSTVSDSNSEVSNFSKEIEKTAKATDKFAKALGITKNKNVLDVRKLTPTEKDIKKTANNSSIQKKLTASIDKNVKKIVSKMSSFFMGKVALEDILNGVKEAVMKPIKWIKDTFKKVIDLPKKIFTKAKDFTVGLFKNIWKGTKAVTKGMWNATKAVTEGVGKLTKGIFNVGKSLSKAAWNAAKSVAKGAYTVLKDVTKGLWEAGKAATKGLWEAGKAATKGLWEAGKAVTKGLWEGAKGLTKGLWKGIKEGIPLLYKGMKTIISDLWGGVKNISKAFWDAGSEIFKGLWKGLKAISSGIWSLTKGIATGVWKGIKGIGKATVTGVRRIFGLEKTDKDGIQKVEIVKSIPLGTFTDEKPASSLNIGESDSGAGKPKSAKGSIISRFRRSQKESEAKISDSMGKPKSFSDYINKPKESLEDSLTDKFFNKKGGLFSKTGKFFGKKGIFGKSGFMAKQGSRFASSLLSMGSKLLPFLGAALPAIGVAIASAVAGVLIYKNINILSDIIETNKAIREGNERIKKAEARFAEKNKELESKTGLSKVQLASIEEAALNIGGEENGSASVAESVKNTLLKNVKRVNEFEKTGLYDGVKLSEDSILAAKANIPGKSSKMLKHYGVKLPEKLIYSMTLKDAAINQKAAEKKAQAKIKEAELKKNSESKIKEVLDETENASISEISDKLNSNDKVSDKIVKIQQKEQEKVKKAIAKKVEAETKKVKSVPKLSQKAIDNIVATSGGNDIKEIVELLRRLLGFSEVTAAGINAIASVDTKPKSGNIAKAEPKPKSSGRSGFVQNLANNSKSSIPPVPSSIQQIAFG